MIGINMHSSFLNYSEHIFCISRLDWVIILLSFLYWNYKHKHVNLYMPVYLEVDMHEYQHKTPTPPPSMHHTNGKYQIMGTKLSGKTTRVTNI